jgi:putative ubiquitin-RnfH superfamily antitoxin RatB of RatAB toxin-antitoxin module
MADDRIDDAALRASVVRARPGSARIVEVRLPRGATLRDAAVASGLLDPAELDDAGLSLGVFGQVKRADAALRDGDRIEIYRPLTIDPKRARRLRAGLRTKRRPA